MRPQMAEMVMHDLYEWTSSLRSTAQGTPGSRSASPFASTYVSLAAVYEELVLWLGEHGQQARSVEGASDQ